MATMLEIMGKEQVSFEKDACISDGGSECRFRFSWK